MAKADLIQTNMTGGELSPALALGRPDIAKYANGLRRAENVVLTIQGGAKRRPGTLFLREVKDSAQFTRLIDFVFNRSQAYMLEMGNGYMRFIRNRAHILNGSTPVEIATPYGSGLLRDITYVQKADTAFLAHEQVTPQRLQRFGDATWVMGAPPFSPAPVEEQGFYPAATLTLGGTTGSVPATASAATFLASDIGRNIVVGGGLGMITAVGSSTLASITITQPFASTTAAAGAWLIDGSPQVAVTPSATGNVGDTIALAATAAWRSDDVGKIVFINAGSAQIVGFTSADSVQAKVLTVSSAVTAAAPGSWTLESPVWNSRTGYPRAVTINTQRLIYAGSMTYPQTVWGSAIQGYLNFSFGVEDDQAYRFELDGPRNSPIRHLAPARKLLVLTDSDEMSLAGTQGKAPTPTDVQKTDESTAGSNGVRPVKIGAEMLSVQATGRKISAIGYRYEIDGFSSPDRTVFASHITGAGVVDMSFKKDPDQTLMTIRTDGVIAACAYDIDQEVTGWCRWITDGAFESVATIPTPTTEDAYTIVRRTVGGATKRYVEVFDPTVLVDCGIARNSVSVDGDTVWNGLGHLEGRQVVIYADGAFLGTQTVLAGSVALPRAAKYAQIGLPFTVLVEPLQIEAGGQGTTSQAGTVDVREVVLRVLDTTGALVNGVPIEFRKFDTPVLDLPPPVVSGEIRSITLQDEIYRTSLVIEQRDPMPFHLLNIIRRVTVNS